MLGDTLSGHMDTYGRCEPTVLKGCDMVFKADLYRIPEASEMQTQGHMNESWSFMSLGGMLLVES